MFPGTRGRMWGRVRGEGGEFSGVLARMQPGQSTAIVCPAVTSLHMVLSASECSIKLGLVTRLFPGKFSKSCGSAGVASGEIQDLPLKWISIFLVELQLLTWPIGTVFELRIESRGITEERSRGTGDRHANKYTLGGGGVRDRVSVRPVGRCPSCLSSSLGG